MQHCEPRILNNKTLVTRLGPDSSRIQNSWESDYGVQVMLPCGMIPKLLHTVSACPALFTTWGKAQKYPKCVGSYHSIWRSRWRSWLLDLAWASPGHCFHLGHESADERYAIWRYIVEKQYRQTSGYSALHNVRSVFALYHLKSLRVLPMVRCDRQSWELEFVVIFEFHTLIVLGEFQKCHAISEVIRAGHHPWYFHENETIVS